jgi:hypothetical protein
MNEISPRLTLYRPATYQIKVPGHLDKSWEDWDDRLTFAVERDADGSSISTLTGALDQAALHGLLRRLYGQGVPLISVIWVEGD